MTDYLDPATLNPESLYKLQSETWEQGAEAERERIIKLLERYQGCRDDELCAYTCSCLRSDRFIELIKGEQK